MKTKLLLAGLIASTAFVGCTNDDLLSTENGVAQKNSFALIFDGFGTPDTRMTYEEGEFEWEINDAIGVLRTMDGENVVSNSKFTAAKVTDDNTKPLTDWNGSGTGKYAYFETENESIFEGNYVMTYPWNKDLTKDGKITAALKATQSAGAATDANYVADYGFMMSTATAFEGGQTTGRFFLYPVFSRLKFNVKSSVTGANLQSVILRSKDGSKIFPTEVEIPANITVKEGYLDGSKMTAKEESKVSQLILTMDDKNLNTTTATENLYLSVIPGTYSNVEIVFVTNKGSYTYQTTQESVILDSGRYAEIDVTIDAVEPNREYYVATAADWKQAMKNISNLADGDGSSVTINVMGEVELQDQDFGCVANSGTPAIIVNGEGKITITDVTSARTNALKNITFNVPVATANGIAFTVIATDNLTFNKGLNVGGTFNINKAATYNIVGGSVKGETTVAKKEAKLTAEDVTFTGAVKVNNTNVAAANGTTNVTLTDCTYKAGLTLDELTGGTANAAITVNGGAFNDGVATSENSILTVGAASTNLACKVILKGTVTAEKVYVQGYASNVATLAIQGDLTVTAEFKKVTTNGIVEISKDASLTLGEDIEYTVQDALLKTEGTLTNNGTLTFAVGGKLTDVDQDNHMGTFINNGTISVPMNQEWYANQNITVQQNKNFYINGVTDITNFAKAIKVSGVTGVELGLTGTAIDFSNGLDNKTDFSAFDIVLNMSSAGTEITVPNGLKFGNLIVKGNQTATLKGKLQAGVAISVNDLTVETSAILTLTPASADYKVSLASVNITNSGTITNAGQISYTGTLKSTGSMTGMPVKE